MWFLSLLACGTDGEPAETDRAPDDSAVDSDTDETGDTDTAIDTDETGDDTGDPDPSELFQGFVPTNIVIIHTDTLRWDHTPWYGYTRNTFPKLTGRSGWVRWERAYATSGWTAPSTTSVLTGRDVHNHGVRMVNELYRDILEYPTFATTYRDQGFATIFVTGNELFEFPAGLTEGFDEMVYLEREPLNSEANINVALESLDRLAEGTPFAMHIQAFDPHQPWRPSPFDLGTWANLDDVPFDVNGGRDTQQAGLNAALDSDDPAVVSGATRAVVDLYDEELLGLDAQIDALLDGLDTRGLLADTLVVFTSDHGETLFDRGPQYGHGVSLYEELVRVPLLFYNPAFTNASVDGCLASTMDIHPTLLAAMGIPLPDELDGESMLDGCRSVVTSTIYREGSELDSPVNLIQMTAATVDTKLLRVCEDGAQVGYDLAADPGSVSPVAMTGETFDLLASTLDRIEAEAAVTWPETSCPVE